MRNSKLTRAAGLLVTIATIHAQTKKSEIEWPYYGGDQGGSKYSALTDINSKNVSGMHQAWVWKTGETPLEKYGTRPGMFQNSPLMIDNVLYLSTPYNKTVTKTHAVSVISSFNPSAVGALVTFLACDIGPSGSVTFGMEPLHLALTALRLAEPATADLIQILLARVRLMRQIAFR